MILKIRNNNNAIIIIVYLDFIIYPAIANINYEHFEIWNIIRFSKEPTIVCQTVILSKEFLHNAMIPILYDFPFNFVSVLAFHSLIFDFSVSF